MSRSGHIPAKSSADPRTTTTAAASSSSVAPTRAAERPTDVLQLDAVVPFATDADGHLRLWRRVTEVCSSPFQLAAEDAGPTGRLANVAINTGCQIWIVDQEPSTRPSRSWPTWPNVQMFANSGEGVVRALEAAWEVMDRRYRMIEDGGATSSDLEPLLVLLDVDPRSPWGLLAQYTWLKGPANPAVRTATRQLTAIVRKGRAAGVYLLVPVPSALPA